MLLRQAVLASLPQLTLQLHQLSDLSACHQTFSSVAVLNLEVKGTGAVSLQEALQLQETLPKALARLPYVRHVAFKGMRSVLLPLLQPLQRLPHVQEISLQGRKGKMTVLPQVLSLARASAQQAAQQAEEQAAQQAAAQQAAEQAARNAEAQQAAEARAQAARQQAAQAAAQQAHAPPAPRKSYKDIILAGARPGATINSTAVSSSKGIGSSNGSGNSGKNGNGSGNSGSGRCSGAASTLSKAGWRKVKANANSITYSSGLVSTSCRRGKQQPTTRSTPSSSSNRLIVHLNASSSSSGRSGTTAAEAVAVPSSAALVPSPRPGPIVHDLSSLRQLTLRRYNLCSVRYSSSSSAGGGCNSSSSSFCPLALLAQHLTRLQALSLQQVVLDKGSLASLAGSPWPAWRQPGSPPQPPTVLRSVLQDLSLSGVKQKHLELHHISALTALTALRLSGLKVVSGLSGSTQAGFGDESDFTDDESDWEDDEQQQGHAGHAHDDEGEPHVQQALLEGFAALQIAGEGAAGAPNHQQQQQAAVVLQANSSQHAAGSTASQQQQQQPSPPSAPPSEPEERHLSRALAHLTNLSVLTISRVPTLIANSSGSNGSSGSSHSYSSSRTEMLPDVLGGLSVLRSLAASLCLSDTRLPGAWGHWSTSLVSLQVGGWEFFGGGEERLDHYCGCFGAERFSTQTY